MKLNRKDDAVSPVIGVMLMLVVTIVIAAVITGFATDLSAGTSSTPMAFFEIDYIDISGENVVKFGIAHKGGDAVPLKDIQISYVTDAGSPDSEGFLNIISSGQLSVTGNDNSVLTTGDVINVQVSIDSLKVIKEGTGVTWTMSHTKSGGVIAKGEFVALPM